MEVRVLSPIDTTLSSLEGQCASNSVKGKGLGAIRGGPGLRTETGVGTSGDQEIPFVESFDSFYQREFRVVVALAFVLSGSRSAAEELAQDAFLAALRRWDRISQYEDPAAWVKRVVSNRSVSRFRRLGAEARARVRMGRVDYTIPEGDVDAEDLWRHVRSLPNRQAQVIALHYLDDRSVAEIASILGISEPTAKTHLQRGRQSLAEAFGKEAT
jgi:RNA polymerase sigma-70 factor (ECF subfamily)